MTYLEQLKNEHLENTTEEDQSTNSTLISRFRVQSTQNMVAIENLAINYFIAPSVPANFATAIPTAADNWTAVTNCRIWFRQVFTAIEADLIIAGDSDTFFLPSGLLCLPFNVFAQAEFPTNGVVGAFISINVNSTVGGCSNGLPVGSFAMTQAHRVGIMEHELGHTVGYRHSNAKKEKRFVELECLRNAPSVMTASFDPSTNAPLAITADDITASRMCYPHHYDTPVLLSINPIQEENEYGITFYDFIIRIIPATDHVNNNHIQVRALEGGLTFDLGKIHCNPLTDPSFIANGFYEIYIDANRVADYDQDLTYTMVAEACNYKGDMCSQPSNPEVITLEP